MPKRPNRCKSFCSFLSRWVLFPITAVTSISILSGRQLFGDIQALPKVYGTCDSGDSRVVTTTTVLFAGSVVTFSVLRGYTLYNRLAKSKGDEKKEEGATLSSVVTETSMVTVDKQQKSYCEKSKEIIVACGSIKSCCSHCKKDHCTCSRHCAGKSMTRSSQLLLLSAVWTSGVIGGLMGAETDLLQFTGQSPDEFLKDDSKTGKIKTYTCLTAAGFFVLQYILFNLLSAFDDANELGEKIKNKECCAKQSCSCKCCTTLVFAFPAVSASGPLVYFGTLSILPKVPFLYNCFSGPSIKTTALVFACINPYVTSLMLVPSVYKLVDAIFTKGFCKIISIPSDHLKICSLKISYKLIAGITIPALWLDAISSGLGSKVSIEFMGKDLLAHNTTDFNQTFPLLYASPLMPYPYPGSFFATSEIFSNDTLSSMKIDEPLNSIIDTYAWSAGISCTILFGAFGMRMLNKLLAECSKEKPEVNKGNERIAIRAPKRYTFYQSIGETGSKDQLLPTRRPPTPLPAVTAPAQVKRLVLR